MQQDIDSRKRRQRRIAVAVVAVASVAAILFVCIFSLYHLPTRNPVETPEMVVDPNDVASPAGDMEMTQQVVNASPEEASAMLGELEMNYQNAALNGENSEAQQAGMRLVYAYEKAGQTQNARNLLQKMMADYAYDTAFTADCQKLLEKWSGDSLPN